MSTQRFHAAGSAIYVDEFDFAGVTNAIDLEIANPTPKITAFADVDETYLEGKPSFKITLNGFYSLVTPNYDGEMFIDLTAEDRQIGIYKDNVAGQSGFEGRADLVGDAIPTQKSQAILLNVTWQGDTPLAEAIVGYINTAVGATVNGTKYQFGAIAATETLVGVLRLLAAPAGAGANNLVVTIESDADSLAGGETTRITFATLNEASVATFEKVELAGAVTDAWWRAVITITGAGTRTFSILVTIGKRKT